MVDREAFLSLVEINKNKQLNKEEFYDKFWQCFLVPLSNDLMKKTIMTQVSAIKLVKFPNASIDFLYKETEQLGQKVSLLLLDRKFELARKELRVYINRLNLELIDQQI